MRFYLSLFYVLIIGALVHHAESKELRERPNVLFLAVDDMNDWIGCLETTPRALTPNIDKLAARGVSFTNAHTAGVFCAPSRAAIFSGQFASTTGCYRTAKYFVSNPKIEALQMQFSAGGYITLGAGKLFHHPAGAIDQRGWDEFFLRNQAQRENGWPLDSWSEETPFPETFPASIYNKGKQVTGGLFLEWGGIPNEKEEAMADTQRINWAVEQLAKKHDRPFFLACGIYAPHFPNYCPRKYFDLYDVDEIELPPMKEDDLDDLPERIRTQKTNRKKQHHDRLVELDAVADAIHGYLACISYADAMMGRVLNALDASSYADNTIVVLWSDHGYHHGEKGDWGKHTLWERTSNVPFIWAGPGVAAGVKTDVTVSLIDMFPTFVEMCDLPKPAQGLEGQSIVATLADPAKAEDRDVFLPYMDPGEYAVINRDWRYIKYVDGEELYDLQKDSHEWTNLAGDGAFDDVIAKLQKTAPSSFSEPEEKLNARKDLVIEGETFRWEKGKGNAQTKPGYVPKTKAPAASSAAKKPATAKPKRKKNVLFIVCDDLNTHVSTSGYEPIMTPTLAQFASEAMTFRRAFCQYPVCGPSRASFLNGLYPESSGVLDNKADIREARPGTVSMPQFFKENGYWTGSVGKVFHSPRHEHGEVAWHEYHRFENDELPVVAAARKKFEAEQGSIDLPKNRKAWKTLEKEAKSKLDAQTPPGYGRSGLTDAQHKDGKNALQVAKWLQEGANGDKPFFIACGIQKPHVPFLAPDKYFDLYPLDQIRYTPDRANLWENLPGSAISKRYEAFGFELGKENDQLRREYMQAYHACISFIDTQIKIVLDAVKESGQWEDTIIAFTSDHGYHLGDHFLWGKVTLFDVGAKVPFLIRAPGLTEGGTASEAMVELIDIYPTLAELNGLNPPAHLQGNSLRPLLDHPERIGKKKYAYSVVSRGEKLGYAIRNQRWRYARWSDGEELYNLTNDPEERRNLANQAGFKERLGEFRNVLAEKQREAASKRDPEKRKKKPNVVFIITDDQSWDSLGFMGGRVHTPRIDQMASEGMLFTDFNVTSTVCSPSRYSFLTGKYAGRCEGPKFLEEHPPGDQTQVENIGELEPEGWNIARGLQRAGYRTGFVGKSHVVRHDWLHTTKPGKDRELETYPHNSDPRDPDINAKMQRNHQRWCEEMKSYGFDFADGVYGANLKELENESLNVHNLEWTVSKAFEFLETSASQEKPFFLYFSTTLHHGPAPWVNRFSLEADSRMTGEGFIEEGFDVMPTRKDVLRRNREQGLPDRDAYALWLDDGVGAILDKLAALGLEEDTLVMFVPDHGSFRHGKATLYEHGMRVPLVARWKGTVHPASRYHGITANIDVAPTLLELAGVNRPADAMIDGVSFAPALFGDKKPIRDILFGELGHSRCVKTKDWKYIAVRYPPDVQKKVDSDEAFRGFEGRPLKRPYLTRNGHLGHHASVANPNYFVPDQLYSLTNDPFENRNVIDQHSPVAARLKERLSEQLRQFENRPFGEFTY